MKLGFFFFFGVAPGQLLDILKNTFSLLHPFILGSSSVPQNKEGDQTIFSIFLKTVHNQHHV